VTGANNEYSHPYHSLALSGLRDAIYQLTEGGQDDRIRTANRVAIELMEAHSPSRECAWNIAQSLLSRKVWIDERAFWGRARARGWDPAADKAIRRVVAGVGA
jgi:hypothetical protein